jgi:hypothetical protein
MYKLICLCSRKAKSLVGIEPWTSRTSSSRLNPCASSAYTNQRKIKVSRYHFTWRLVTYVRRRTSLPPSPRHHDHVAGPSDCGAPTRRPGGRAAVGQGRRRPSGLQNRASLTTLAKFSLSELLLRLRDSATVTR